MTRLRRFFVAVALLGCLPAIARAQATSTVEAGGPGTGGTDKAVTPPPPAPTFTPKMIGGIPQPATPEPTLDQGACGGWQCGTLEDLAAKDPSDVIVIKNWCKAHTLLPKFKATEDDKAVCSAVDAMVVSQDAAGKPVLTKTEGGRTVSFIIAEKVFDKQVVQSPDCSGWGLTVGVFSIRYDTAHVIKGPIAAGLGGGYYKSLVCHHDWTFGFEGFGYSEGLDPGGLFHLGMGAGLDLVAFNKFSFGLAAAYDLYRHQAADMATNTVEVTQGLFDGDIFNKKAAASLLVTFSVTQGTEGKSSTKDANGKDASTSTTPVTME
jgi:hypothetical protein